MIVAQRGDDVRAYARVGERLGQSSGKSDRFQAGMYPEADPRPVAVGVGADRSQALILADQGKGVAQLLFGRRLEGVALSVQARLQTA